MKLLCFFILLINISFFLWEYRKGAPDVYKPQDVTAYASRTQGKQQIFLTSELPSVEKNTTQVAATMPVQKIETEALTVAVDSVGANDINGDLLLSASLAELKIVDALSTYLAKEFIPPLYEQLESTIDKEKKQNIVADELVESINEVMVKNAISEQQMSFIGPPTPKNSLTIATSPPDDIDIACYILQRSQYKKEMQALANSGSNYKLKFIDQEQEFISSYLVLTSAADSLQEAKEQASSIKQQGIEELWLFRQGEFKWRISLGLFSTKVKAVKARKNYGQQITQVLNIVPSIRKKIITIVNVTTANEAMTAFEGKFSVFIDQKISCTAND